MLRVKMDLQEAECGLRWLRIGTGTCESSNEPSGSITCRKFLD
jgi:hypothetical protein